MWCHHLHTASRYQSASDDNIRAILAVKAPHAIVNAIEVVEWNLLPFKGQFLLPRSTSWGEIHGSAEALQLPHIVLWIQHSTPHRRPNGAEIYAFPRGQATARTAAHATSCRAHCECAAV
jgi:hypothetical protein